MSEDSVCSVWKVENDNQVCYYGNNEMLIILFNRSHWYSQLPSLTYSYMEANFVMSMVTSLLLADMRNHKYFVTQNTDSLTTRSLIMYICMYTVNVMNGQVNSNVKMQINV